MITTSFPAGKYIANILTSLRVVFAAAMLTAAPFTPAFWACYLCGGLSDLMDGAAARAFKTQSAAGARLDSAADLAFAAAIAAVFVRCVSLPGWMWAGAACAAAMRLTGYAIGFARFRAFSSLHTWANKAAGAIIFGFPLLYGGLGLTASGIILVAAAIVSAAEEIAITATAGELSRDCKSLFARADGGRKNKT